MLHRQVGLIRRHAGGEVEPRAAPHVAHQRDGLGEHPRPRRELTQDRVLVLKLLASGRELQRERAARVVLVLVGLDQDVDARAHVPRAVDKPAAALPERPEDLEAPRDALALVDEVGRLPVPLGVLVEARLPSAREGPQPLLDALDRRLERVPVAQAAERERVELSRDAPRRDEPLPAGAICLISAPGRRRDAAEERDEQAPERRRDLLASEGEPGDLGVVGAEALPDAIRNRRRVVHVHADHVDDGDVLARVVDDEVVGREVGQEDADVEGGTHHEHDPEGQEQRPLFVDPVVLNDLRQRGPVRGLAHKVRLAADDLFVDHRDAADGRVPRVHMDELERERRRAGRALVQDLQQAPRVGDVLPPGLQARERTAAALHVGVSRDLHGDLARPALAGLRRVDPERAPRVDQLHDAVAAAHDEAGSELHA